MANDPQYIIIHTAAFTGSASIEDIDNWHRKRGFSKVGYHYYIRRDGEVQKGRDELEVGAHCIDRGMNHKSIGICFEGHGDKEPWTPEQLVAYLFLVRTIQRAYSIPNENILGHRETGSPKTCPGTKVDMDWVRYMTEFADPEKVNALPVDKVKGVLDIA